jgi:hypothetical protein
LRLSAQTDGLTVRGAGLWLGLPQLNQPAAGYDNVYLEAIDQVSLHRSSHAHKRASQITIPFALKKLRWLIDELLQMENPATCPHGRPIILRMTVREIEKGFQRT